MKKSVGFTQEQLLTFIRERVPKFVEVSVVEQEEFFNVSLKLQTGQTTTSGVRKTVYPENLPDEQVLLGRIKDRTVKELTELILGFSSGIIDGLIKSFNLERFYRDKFEDKNELYKIKKWHEKKDEFRTVRTNIENYYFEEATTLIPTREPLWQALVKETLKHDNSKELIDYIFGAHQRIEQLLFARDIINDIVAKNNADNDSEFAVSFHVFHFISLVKSLSDNLAWILNLYCKMNVYEKSVDLVRKSFENRLLTNNEKLQKIIYGQPNFKNLIIIKSFRDVTHHKHALHAETIKMGFQNNAPQKIMIPLDPKSGLLIDGKRHLESLSPKLAEASDKESIAKYGLRVLHVWVGPPVNMPWQDPDRFCQTFIDTITTLYNLVYSRIFLELTRKPVGKVIHYYQKIGVAIVILTESVKVGDDIVIEGNSTAVHQKLTSIEIEHKPIEIATAGQTVGLKTKEIARLNDLVFKTFNPDKP